LRRVRDITAHAKKIVFSGYFEAGAQLELTDDGLRVVRPGKFTKMVDAVEHVTFAGQRALRTGQDVLYVTERCVMRLTESGLVATEVMPGIRAEEDIVQASGGRVRVAENAVTMPTALLRDAPMGMSL
jgi:propionate CoA-transferase